MTFLISSSRVDNLMALPRVARVARMARVRRMTRGAALAGLLAGALSLTGCYVVPIQPYSHSGSQQGPAVYVPPAPAMPAIIFFEFLYLCV